MLRRLIISAILLLCTALAVPHHSFAAPTTHHHHTIDAIADSQPTPPSWTEIGMTDIIVYIGENNIPAPSSPRKNNTTPYTPQPTSHRLIVAHPTSCHTLRPAHTAQYTLRHYCQLRL